MKTTLQKSYAWFIILVACFAMSTSTMANEMTDLSLQYSNKVIAYADAEPSEPDPDVTFELRSNTGGVLVQNDISVTYSYSDKDEYATVDYWHPITISSDASGRKIVKIELEGSVLGAITEQSGFTTYTADKIVWEGVENYVQITSDDYDGARVRTAKVWLSGHGSGSISEGSFSTDFTKDEFGDWTIIDNNGDKSPWRYDDDFGTNYYTNWRQSADDYLILTPIALTAGTTYNYVLECEALDAPSYPERIEVLVGTSPAVAGLTQTIVSPTLIDKRGTQELNGSFSVASSGVYYIAFHVISDADQGTLRLHHFEIAPEQGSTPSVASVRISSSGYATYYNEFAYVMPEGLIGKIMEENTKTGDIVANALFQPNDVVPAETALLLKGDEREYTLILTDEDADDYLAEYAESHNLLKGRLTAGMTEGEGKHYKFTRDEDGLGWYYGAENGAPFTISANKAYLVVPNGLAMSTRFISIDDVITSIDSVKANADSDLIYDLAGRRINEPTKGMYIINGKKVIY